MIFCFLTRLLFGLLRLRLRDETVYAQTIDLAILASCVDRLQDLWRVLSLD